MLARRDPGAAISSASAADDSQRVVDDLAPHTEPEYVLGSDPIRSRAEIEHDFAPV
ncbi:hypothetical protein [Mycobacterium sp. OTB74]|jgi:hypothetical protein|uniref:hypothetical protein n=1 Tax=Mycobacterium sp. OTB74 TaxID=1853452 RepID=UPI002475485A|nr:hypothetical protein [Mycobacterium sp. OTB74]MDH6244863.1 hypothetical protein [Mycobacterium sp. OTB74]